MTKKQLHDWIKSQVKSLAAQAGIKLAKSHMSILTNEAGLEYCLVVADEERVCSNFVECDGSLYVITYNGSFTCLYSVDRSSCSFSAFSVSCPSLQECFIASDGAPAETPVVPSSEEALASASDESVASDLAVAREALAGSVNVIRQELHSIANSFCKIGYELWVIKTAELYRALEFADIYGFGKTVLGLGKTSITQYIAVCERYSVRDEQGNPTAVILTDYQPYSYTQLCEMLPLPEGVAAGVSPDMTCKEIRALKPRKASSRTVGGCDDDQSTDQSGPQPVIDASYGEIVYEGVVNGEDEVDVLVNVCAGCRVRIVLLPDLGRTSQSKG